MVMSKFINNTLADGNKVMDNFNVFYSLNILDKLKQNINRVSIDSNGHDDIFSEVYTDVDGQNNTVNTGNTTLTFDVNKYKATGSDQIIEHTISSGTYSSTISKLIGKGLYEDWEDGVSIQHRLENATENSGWIDDEVLGEFTAFTSEPTKYIVKLIQKDVAPTSGYPSIRGSGVYCD